MNEFLVFYSLVVWRVTALLVYDTIMGPFRDRVGVTYDEHSNCQGQNFVAMALCCHKCTSIWVALATLLFIRAPLKDLPVQTLMLSAGSILINKMVNGE